MFVRQYQTERFTVKAEMENDTEVISFDKCFIINTPDILPKTFKVRDDRVYCKNKLKKYSNVLFNINCTGKVEFKDLQKLFPTVFDTNEIRKINQKEYIKENYKEIVNLSQDILGLEKVESILKKKY
ncbi:uncharacterized protein VICG_00576 [Vittaforma corneae ATCC 50505]|uniref:Uncharacterized protein n=1 Tax=Vittaforma corneae (strain ATCC 50505) TaxID=993615 RepID=L2GQ72_VITCO|nr:uncharacterized protein VICG_00576 [Vittaforma corneae ATCC 50505]ELA42477.1 hypothetical protein VICG_00576 [Vittaforma corneae ATCC 50505]